MEGRYGVQPAVNVEMNDLTRFHVQPDRIENGLWRIILVVRVVTVRRREAFVRRIAAVNVQFHDVIDKSRGDIMDIGRIRGPVDLIDSIAAPLRSRRRATERSDSCSRSEYLHQAPSAHPMILQDLNQLRIAKVQFVYSCP